MNIFGILAGAGIGTVGAKVAREGFERLGSANSVQMAGVGFRRLGAKFRAGRVEKFKGVLGERIAEGTPLGFGAVFKTTERAMPGSADNLVGEAKKAQEKMIRKSTNNLFLGIRMRKPAQAAVIGASVIGIGASQMVDEVKRESYGDPMSSMVESAGDMPRANADMIGGVQNGRRDLGATGDIVLALNKRRRG